ncbi:hypothetical protein PoB_007335100 [Plakobranchus ocellatus]|uniref:Uncharacterized protein n=1 Tax=Plakobranchus ocellatus TaxID=259542 RepID=A0AAV4DSP5_9GAST|nr:hypothetical protein PoB_007335100 [Plakobranchus ocellatus]
MKSKDRSINNFQKLGHNLDCSRQMRPSYPFSAERTQRSNEKLTCPGLGFEPRTSDLVADCPTSEPPHPRTLIKVYKAWLNYKYGNRSTEAITGDSEQLDVVERCAYEGKLSGQLRRNEIKRQEYQELSETWTQFRLLKTNGKYKEGRLGVHLKKQDEGTSKIHRLPSEKWPRFHRPYTL